MIKRQIEKIISASSEQRDVLLDDLNDLLENATLEPAEAASLVQTLSLLVDSGANDVVLESFFNILSTLYFQGLAREEIEGVVSEKIYGLPVNSLAHALEIVGASNIAGKGDNLEAYAQHENRYIGDLVQSLRKKI